jgi:murein DD-endopeptidase MepM/ murein hydrolase activator NlpD
MGRIGPMRLVALALIWGVTGFGLIAGSFFVGRESVPVEGMVVTAELEKPSKEATGGAGRKVDASGGVQVRTASGGASMPRSSLVSSGRERADIAIRLPWLPGEAYDCIQGNHGNFTHHGLNQYAFDFAMPVGTLVTAAAAGRVVRVKQTSREGGIRIRDFAAGNVVIIDHGRGLFSQYLHLKHQGARVREGDLVEAGQIIAESGNTGFSTTPHLHFQVQDATGQSLPVRFLDVPGEGVPQMGLRYVSANNGKGTTPFAGDSPFPVHAFAAQGIILTDSNLPGHLFSTDVVYRFRGYVSEVPTSRRLAVYVMGATGGRAQLWAYATVGADGFFEAELDLSALPMRSRSWNSSRDHSNLFALAFAPVQPDGSFWSTISIPITVR